MARIRYHTADVFTDHLFGGNPVAVVPDAHGLEARTMKLVAREFNYSETVFVLPAETAGGTCRLRIFTPKAEIPFAGHPTVGTAFVLAATGAIPLEGEVTRIVFEEGVGSVPVAIRSAGGRVVSTELTVARLPEREDAAPSRAEAAALLSLDEADVEAGDWSPAIVSCGLPFLFVAVTSVAAVGRARLDDARWPEFHRAFDVTGTYVFRRNPGTNGIDVRARMFAPAFGVPEDPATGSAAAALAGLLAPHEPGGDGGLRWTIEQGVEMGRPSLIEVEADRRAGRITSVRVGGSSVLVAEGRMDVP